MSALPVVTRRRMDANDPDFRPYEPDVLSLIERHGIDYRVTRGGECVVWVEYDVFDTALLRFGLGLRDDDGRYLLECEHRGEHAPSCRRNGGPDDDDCRRLAIEPVERALIGDLPEWWQPEADR